MSLFIEQFVISFNAVVPFFLVMALGWAALRLRFINDALVASLNRLVFFLFLPATLFLNIYRADIGAAFDLNLVIFFIVSVLLFYLLTWLIASRFLAREKLGAFVQAGYRSNYVILATAIIALLMGEEALPKTALMIPFLVSTYSILAAVAFVVNAPQTEDTTRLKAIRNVLLGILKTPLIIAVLIGITVNLIGLPLPTFLTLSIGYVSDMATPAALFGIGGVLSLEKVRRHLKLAVAATLVKNILMPIALIIPAVLLGFRGIELAIIAMIALTPTALVSYATAESMGGDGDLAASCLVLSSATALFTIVPALTILRVLGLF